MVILSVVKAIILIVDHFSEIKWRLQKEKRFINVSTNIIHLQENPSSAALLRA